MSRDIELPAKLPIPKTPECDKLEVAVDKLGTQQIGAFLEWCESQNMQLCYRITEAGGMTAYGSVLLNIQQILAKYAGIDLNKVDEEKKALIKYLRDQREEDAK